MSLIAVLIPLLFMGDIVGRLFREFAVTLARHDSGFRGRVADADADDVRAAPAPQARVTSRGASTGRPSALSTAMIAFYGTNAAVGARPPDRDALWSPSARSWLTVVLYIIVPKGFFPVQDTGVILGISEAPQTVSFAAMAERQQALAQVILEDPAVESLSSFIGVDGTNTTLEQRAHPDQPEAARRAEDERERHHPPPAAGAGQVEGITLFMQPVQDLTVEDRVSRTQYQYSLEDADPKEFGVWGPRSSTRLRTLPQLRDVASDDQKLGLPARLVIDRDTASRFGIRPQTIDDTLYDACWSAPISTMFTQIEPVSCRAGSLAFAAEEP